MLKSMNIHFKYITVAAFRIYAQRGEDAAERGGWRPSCINSHGNNIVDYGKIMEKSWNCVIYKEIF